MKNILKKGRIKNINHNRGYGFVAQESGKEYRFDKREIRGFNPSDGDLITFVLQRQGSYTNAINVKLIYKFPKHALPKDTRDIMKTRINEISNFQLLVGKYLELNTDYSFLIPKKLSYNFKYLKEFRNKLEKNLINNWKNVKVYFFTYKTASRLLVGLGNPSVLENNLTFHHLYGFPYIPGSAIKGILRNYIINEFFLEKYKQYLEENENLKEKDKKKLEDIALEDKYFCDIFGCPKNSFYPDAHQGNVYFLDAIPITDPILEIDVMTPHYGQYYQNLEPPGDYFNPVPIQFLAVAKDVAFKFYFGIKNNVQNTIIREKSPLVNEDTPLVDLVRNQLKKALEFQGIGGKTAVGYGYFY